MPFSFLNPWLWLGALAIAAPLWLHLRRKRETNVIRFSAVRFLQDQLEPRRSPLRLRNLFLFVLRVLALVLLVAAFAWPYVKGPDTMPIRESRVYILDNTLSHQANAGFTRDRDRIAKDFSTAGPDTQLAVVELTSNPRVLVSFGDNRAEARQKLVELKPSYQRGSYLAAFRQANAILANSLGFQKRIVFLGDNQANQWRENLTSPPFLRNVEIDLPKSNTPELPNLALAEPRIQRIFLGDKSPIYFTAKLSHWGPAGSAGVRLQANDQTIFNRMVDLQNQPETIMLQAQWEAEPADWVTGEVTIDGAPNANAGDDRLYFSLPPVVEGRVAVLAQSSYLRLALSPEVMRGQWAARILDPAQLAAEIEANRDEDVLCLESNYLQSGDARKLVTRYLTNGRGVVLFLNRITPTIKASLRELGFEGEAVEESRASRFQYVVSNHPIFHPFLSPDYGNLMEVKINKYVRLTAKDALPLVFSDQGAALFFQGTRFPGKLFVASFGMDREHTTWPVHQTFIPFLDLALQSARAEDKCPSFFEPGEVAVFPVPPGNETNVVILRGGGSELARSVVRNSTAQLHLPGLPGLYSVTYGNDDTVQKVFSVNPSPKESELVYLEGSEAMKTWCLTSGSDAGKPATSSPSGRLSLAAILRQNVWWWMLLAAVLALFLENAFAGSRRQNA
jgi:hypothetical protein